MDENTVAVFIFVLGVATSLLLVAFIYINHSRSKKEFRIQSKIDSVDNNIRSES